jgi:hypothetical protein
MRCYTASMYQKGPAHFCTPIADKDHVTAMPAIRAKPTRSYPHVPGNMPAERRKPERYFHAKDEITGVRYKFKVSKETKERFRGVGAPARRGNAYHKEPLVRPTGGELERRLVVSAKIYDQERAERSLLDRLCIERQKLEDRITSPPPPPSYQLYRTRTIQLRNPHSTTS